MEEYKIILLDNDNIQYGIVSVLCGWKEFYVRNLIQEFLVDSVANVCAKDKKEKFYENFSENISYMLEKLEQKVKEKFENGYVRFDYYNVEIFNVDNIFEEQYTTEWCDECGMETEISIYGGYCSHCGKYLLPCSMCDMNKVNCSKCEKLSFEKGVNNNG